ncbi:MAG: DUF1573 domain-containing protein [Deltaproteobacteria bacterium]|nr:DUF1573 domain-containing protein [Deltaproteobacteria bacterium]
MKHCVIFCLVALFIVISVTSTAMAVQGDGPQLYLKEKTFDFGKVDEGKTIEHAFTVYNRGNQPLKIERVRPD